MKEYLKKIGIILLLFVIFGLIYVGIFYYNKYSHPIQTRAGVYYNHDEKGCYNNTPLGIKIYFDCPENHNQRTGTSADWLD